MGVEEEEMIVTILCVQVMSKALRKIRSVYKICGSLKLDLTLHPHQTVPMLVCHIPCKGWVLYVSLYMWAGQLDH